MRTFLDRFYDYVKSPEGFNCVKFEYQNIVYQITAGANVSFTDRHGNRQYIQLPDDVEQILDSKVLKDGKSLREVWSQTGENELFPEFY